MCTFIHAWFFCGKLNLGINEEAYASFLLDIIYLPRTIVIAELPNWLFFFKLPIFKLHQYLVPPIALRIKAMISVKTVEPMTAHRIGNRLPSTFIVKSSGMPNLPDSHKPI